MPIGVSATCGGGAVEPHCAGPSSGERRGEVQPRGGVADEPLGVVLPRVAHALPGGAGVALANDLNVRFVEVAEQFEVPNKCDVQLWGLQYGDIRDLSPSLQATVSLFRRELEGKPG